MRQLLFLLAFIATPAFASTEGHHDVQSYLDHPIAWVALAIFCGAYLIVIFEEQLHIAKSKPVMLAAGILWFLVAALLASKGNDHAAETAVRHNLLEFGELFLFLLAAMTYINTLEERGLFDAVRAWLVQRKFSRRGVFWATGLIAFWLSPVADNLTTALVMGAVLLSVAKTDKKFVGIGCINVVIAANAGGAFSPFGDITTLMVWQSGDVAFAQFFSLLLPSAVCWLVPAGILHFFVEPGMPESDGNDADVVLKPGAKTVALLFLATIAMAVVGHSFFHLPPVLGMMSGLAVLQFYGLLLRRADKRVASDTPFDIFERLKHAEWDTLLFFYGVILCVGALGTLGYLTAVADFAYGGRDPVYANIAVGFLSAIVDNIPVMFAVLQMNPEMSVGHWLLVTLTAGVGGSMLAVGSAAGVALLGASKGNYTFFGHLKYSWAILIGYAAAIVVHLLVNKSLFDVMPGG